MSISTEWEVNNIKRYANILEKMESLKMQLSNLHDDLINLACVMSNEDINQAQLLFESKYQLPFDK